FTIWFVLLLVVSALGAIAIANKRSHSDSLPFFAVAGTNHSNGNRWRSHSRAVTSMCHMGASSYSTSDRTVVHLYPLSTESLATTRGAPCVRQSGQCESVHSNCSDICSSNVDTWPVIKSRWTPRAERIVTETETDILDLSLHRNLNLLNICYIVTK